MGPRGDRQNEYFSECFPASFFFSPQCLYFLVFFGGAFLLSKGGSRFIGEQRRMAKGVDSYTRGGQIVFPAIFTKKTDQS